VEHAVGETFDFDGRHVRVQGSPALPKPGQSPRVVDRLGEYAAAGSSRTYLQLLDLADLDHLDLVAAEVLPHV
jgi:alkanesulfonate monooxygenase SsuD/methylene tetrahydromethanopterin reductase-like flavin-dependent oxidoreductase (luciferase family)